MSTILIITCIIITFCTILVFINNKKNDNIQSHTPNQLSTTLPIVSPTPSPTLDKLQIKRLEEEIKLLQLKQLNGNQPYGNQSYGNQPQYINSYSPYVNPLYNLYNISPLSSLYTYLVDEHPHGWYPRSSGPTGSVVQNFNTTIGSTGTKH